MAKKSKKASTAARTVPIQVAASLAQPVGKREGGVEVVGTETARLFTLDASWEGWRDAKFSGPFPSGAFFRLRPPEGASEAVVLRYEAMIRAAGSSVQVERAATSSAVPSSVEVEAGIAPHRRAREVVEALVEESGGDREAIRVIVASVMAEVGL